METSKMLVMVALIWTVSTISATCGFCRYHDHLAAATCWNLELKSNTPVMIEKNDTSRHLERLILNNATGIIDCATFTELPHLSGLWIKRSTITEVAPGALAALPNLVLLVLKSNSHFPQLSAPLFEGAHLTWLSLISNANTTIKQDSLHHLVSATWLHFQHQHLDTLTGDLLRNTRRLHELTIMHCNLHEILEDAFRQVPNLEILSLNFNKIATLKAGIFRNLDKLRILEMHHNPLAELDVMVFKDLVSLEVVGFPSGLVRALHVEDLLGTFPNLKKMEIKRRDLFRNDTRALVRQLRKHNVQMIGTPHDCHLPHPPYYSCDSNHTSPHRIV